MSYIEANKRNKAQISERIADKVRNRLNIDESLANGIVFKIAESQDELEQAYRLVHDSYKEAGYTDMHPSGMRIDSFNALPDTSVFIAKKDKQVIMTMTLVADSPLGLPIDGLYSDEIAPLRARNHRIGQLSAFASLSEYRYANQTLPLFLIKLMGRYARDYMCLDDLVITINPKHSLFYEYLLLFKKIGGLKSCQEVKGHPAYAYLLELKHQYALYKQTYDHQTPNKNIHHFFDVKQHENVLFPEDKTPLYVWNNKMFNYFFVDKTDVFEQLDAEYRSYILQRHASYWRRDEIDIEVQKQYA